MRFLFLLSILFCMGCQNTPSSTLKVAASSVPHAEILEIVKSEMAKEGLTLEIIIIDDYQLPNRLLAEGQVDANFFQHMPFLEKEMIDFGYELLALAKVHLEPLGIYAKNISSFTQLKSNSVITIPSDPTNEMRALRLLEKANLIKLKSDATEYATVCDIEKNPYSLKLKEVDAPILPRTLSDVECAVIPGNFALQGEIDSKYLLLQEDASSPYANIIVIRKSDVGRKDIEKLVTYLKSEKIQKFIQEKYKGKILVID